MSYETTGRKYACFDHAAKKKQIQSNKKDDNFDLLRREQQCCTKADPFDKLPRNDTNITYSRMSAPFMKRHEEVICVLRASENKIHPNITASTERQVPFMLSSRKISF